MLVLYSAHTTGYMLRSPCMDLMVSESQWKAAFERWILQYYIRMSYNGKIKNASKMLRYTDEPVLNLRSQPYWKCFEKKAKPINPKIRRLNQGGI